MDTGYDFSWDSARHVALCRRTYAADRSLYLPMSPWTPPVAGAPGWRRWYDPARIQMVRERCRSSDRRAYLRGILDKILQPGMAVAEQVRAVLGFVHNACYYNPLEVPMMGDDQSVEMVVDPLELLELHDARCGQYVEIVLALLAEAGIEARRVQIHHHVVAEARWDGAWHLCDASILGSVPPVKDGRWLSVAEMQAEPYFGDSLPQECFLYSPDELTSADGYRVLGYVFGEWGTMPYYSWYMGAPKDYPPTLPYPLLGVRLDERTVRLRWAESVKAGGEPVEYELTVAADRGGTEIIFQTRLRDAWFDWEVPELMRMYYYSVRAMDDHRRLNPHTWYPQVHSNFVLPPVGQYGYYGLLDFPEGGERVSPK